MLFNSLPFLIFLPIVVAVYYLLRWRAQNVFLVLASYFFYGWWDWRFCSLLAFSTVLDYTCALGMERVPARRRLFLWLSLSGNLGVLGFFKYYDFFIASLVDLLSQLGLKANVPLLQVILPVGISFYTFQTLSYTLDVHAGKMKATRNFVALAAYVSFFPQLVAGPIERARNLLPQFLKPRAANASMIRAGAFLILLGYFKKVAVADAVAGEVDSIFAAASESSWPVLFRGVWLFAIQIYCDFSGYSDIARGIARLLGFELMVNFNQPYLSTNITEFWRRWHISLSTWLRDYLYIPLGGNRRGKARTCINVMITMLLGGLWHGANWTFVIWGALHGVYLTVHKWMLHGRKTGGGRLAFARALLTFHLVLFAWVFFRAEDLGAALDYLQGIFTLRGDWGDETFNYVKLLFFTALVLFVDLPQYRSGTHERMLQWTWGVRAVVFWLMLLAMLALSPGEEVPFVYFQF